MSSNGLPHVFHKPWAGRPRKYEDGYCKAAKVLEENFIEWQQVKREEGLTDNYNVTRYLTAENNS